MYLIFRPNIQFQGRRSTLEAYVGYLDLTSDCSQRGNLREAHHVSQPSYLWTLSRHIWHSSPLPTHRVIFWPLNGADRSLSMRWRHTSTPVWGRGEADVHAAPHSQISTRTYAEPSVGKSDKEWKQGRPPPWVRRGEDAGFLNNTWWTLWSNQINPTTHIFTLVITGYIQATRNTQKVQKTHASCVSFVDELFITKLKTNVLALELLAGSLSALLFKSSDICFIFYSSYLDAFYLLWPLPPSLSRSLESLFSPYRCSPPSKPPQSPWSFMIHPCSL